MNKEMKKMVYAGIFVALGVVGSYIHFPVLGTKCAPVQHFVNIICAILLGPHYAVLTALLTSVLRNLFGLGTLFAFPGSLFGALLAGVLYKKTKNTFLTYLGEVVGTSILGGIGAYFIAILFLGKDPQQMAFYSLIIPFFISTFAGSIIAMLLVETLKKANVLDEFIRKINSDY